MVLLQTENLPTCIILLNLEIKTSTCMYFRNSSKFSSDCAALEWKIDLLFNFFFRSLLLSSVSIFYLSWFTLHMNARLTKSFKAFFYRHLPAHSTTFSKATPFTARLISLELSLLIIFELNLHNSIYPSALELPS